MKRKFTKITAGQIIFLVTDFYFQNNLDNCACACAYGFLFSFIPVVFMIMGILIPFIRTSPEIITPIIESGRQFKDMFNIEKAIDSLLAVHAIGWMELVLGFFVFWMARRFFLSIMQGMRRIFHQAVPARPLFNQLLIFAGEILMVFLAAVMVFIVLSLRTIRKLPVLSGLSLYFPRLLSTLTINTFSIMPYVLIFLFVAAVYKAASGTKPSWKICFISSGTCTFIFMVISRLMGKFLDMNSYNIIYGVLSNLIVLLFEVFIFFTLFLLFAQLIFVYQFFDELLLGELYLLPERDDTRPLSTVRRILFIKPDYLIQQNRNVITLKAGETVFNADDTGIDAFYIVSGSVTMSRHNNITYFEKGSFFGELSCIINKTRDAQAVASADTKLIRINGSTFRYLLKWNPDVATKALSQISDYITELYGRKDNFLL